MRNFLLASAVFAATLGFTASAAADSTIGCNGSPVRLIGPLGLHQNLCSMPYGSAQSTAYIDAVWQWNNVVGMYDMLEFGSPEAPDVCTLYIDKHTFEIGLTDQSNIGPLKLGQTYWHTPGCPGGGDAEYYDDMTVLISNLSYQNFTNPDEAMPSGSFPGVPSLNTNNTGATVMLHELGHAQGGWNNRTGGPDNHSVGFSMQRASTPSPHGGGDITVIHAVTMGTDGAVGRFLYPSGKQETNLTVSGSNLANGSIVPTAAFKTTNAIAGQTLPTFTFTVVSQSTGVTGPYNQTFYIANTPYGHNQAGITLATLNGGVSNPANSYNFPISVQIPCGTPPDLYWIYHYVDFDNTIGEQWENDNVIHTAMTVQVLPGGC